MENFQRKESHDNLITIDRDILCCLICTEIAYDALECSSCSSILCRICHSDFIKSYKSCLTCRKNTIFKPSIMLRKIICNIKSECPLNCGKILINSEMNKHVIQHHAKEEISDEIFKTLQKLNRIKIFDDQSDVVKQFKYHHHPLEKYPIKDKWICAGKILFEGKTNCQNHKEDNHYLFRCDMCDLDVCQSCVEEKNVESFNVGKYHAHDLVMIERDNGWGCDGRQPNGLGRCYSGFTGFGQSKGFKRFRCNMCDFDFCEKCLKFALTNK